MVDVLWLLVALALVALAAWLAWLLYRAGSGGGAGGVSGRTYVESIAEESAEGGTVWNTQLTSTQKATVRIGALTDADGRAVSILGVPTWTTSDPMIATIEPSADGLSCVVRSGPEPGVGGFGAAIITTTAETNGGPWQEIGEVLVGASGPITGGIVVESVEEE